MPHPPKGWCLHNWSEWHDSEAGDGVQVRTCLECGQEVHEPEVER